MGSRHRGSGRPTRPADVVNPRVDGQHGPSSQPPATLPGGHELVAHGSRFAIYFACDPRGVLQAKQFLQSLDPNDQGKFFAKMQKFKDHMMQERREYDTLTDGLYEIIIFGSRFIGFYADGRRAFLTHGFTKRRSGSTPPQEIDRARAIRTHAQRSLAS